MFLKQVLNKSVKIILNNKKSNLFNFKLDLNGNSINYNYYSFLFHLEHKCKYHPGNLILRY